MHSCIEEIRNTCLTLPSVPEKLRCLRDRFAGETMYIAGCGPSFDERIAAELERRSAGQLVVALKQAYLRTAAYCDIHLVNRYKYTPYQYQGRRPIILATSQPGKPFQGESDICLPLLYGSRDFQHSLSVKGDLDEWTMGRRVARCCGPGVLFELGFFLAEYLGVSRIITVGVDFNREPHFYAEMPDVRNQLPAQLHGTPTEYQALLRGIPKFCDWLRYRDIVWQYVATQVQTPLSEHVQAISW